jgi:hypothetical protein
MKLDKFITKHSIKPKKVNKAVDYMREVYEFNKEMKGGNIYDDEDELPTTYPTKDECCMSGTGFYKDDDDMLIDDGDETTENIYDDSGFDRTIPGLYDMKVPLSDRRRESHPDSDYYIILPGETRRTYIKRIDEEDYEQSGVDDSPEHMESIMDEEDRIIREAEYKEVSGQLLDPSDSGPMTQLKEEERLPNRGVAFELFTHDSYASQSLLKYVSETTQDFKDIKENPNYYIDGDMSRPRKVYSRDAYSMALYDFWNNESIIELKWYINDDVCSVQDGKFFGNGYSTPLFIENTEGKLVLYNVWNDNIRGYVYPSNNKSLFIYARLDDGLYMLDMLSLINGENPPIDVDTPMRTALQQTPNGEQLYSMKKTSLDTYFDYRDVIANNTRTRWYDLKKSQMKKLN